MIDLSRRRVLAGAGIGALVAAGLYGLPRDAMPARPVCHSGNGACLSEDEVALVAAMAETIIPATDTPGAIGAEVPAFIAMMFADWMTPQEQATFRAGLAGFDTDARARHGKPLARCSKRQQADLVQALDAAAMAKPPHHGEPKSAYALFKALTVVGYYTSKVGQEQELKTEMSAGQFVPGGPVMMTIPLKI